MTSSDISTDCSKVNSMEEVIQALRQLRVGIIIEERALQDRIEEVLLQAGLEHEREYQLGTGDRVDFLTGSGVAIEVKKGKPNRTQLVAQVERYAKHQAVKAVVIVVETSLRWPVSETQNGKPCAVVGLQKLWGIAL